MGLAERIAGFFNRNSHESTVLTQQADEQLRPLTPDELYAREMASAEKLFNSEMLYLVMMQAQGFETSMAVGQSIRSYRETVDEINARFYPNTAILASPQASQDLNQGNQTIV